MLLHHSASVILISFSYLSGLTHVGIQVLFLMDSSDSLVGLIRAIMDIWNKYAIIFVYLTLMYLWIRQRIYIYFTEILWNGFFGEKPVINDSTLCFNLLTGLLWLLLVLNIYWGILLTRMGFGYLVKGKKEDLQFKVKSNNE